jgi:hypothetical protein
MQALADHIGASLRWQPTPHGGTQVCLVLVKSA